MSPLFPFQVGLSSFHGSYPEFFMSTAPFPQGEVDFLEVESSLLKAPQQDQFNPRTGFPWKC